jgi:hypothetical protein
VSTPLSEPSDIYQHVEVIEYDSEKGIVAMYDEFTRSEYEVRAGMLDRAIRAAAIIELERLGYTVIPPEEKP